MAPGPKRDEITRDLATALAMNARGEEAVAVLERELDALPADAGDRRVLLATQLGLGMLVDALVVDASARVEREAADLTGGTAAERLLLGSLALIRARTGTKGAAAAADVAERALAAGGMLRDEAPNTLVLAFVSLVLLAADRDVDAERWLERVAARAREDGAEMTLGIAELGLAAASSVFRGDLAGARATLERSLERARLGSSYGRVVTGGTLMAMLVDCGELDAADRLLAELNLDAGPLPGVGCGDHAAARAHGTAQRASPPRGGVRGRGRAARPARAPSPPGAWAARRGGDCLPRRGGGRPRAPRGRGGALERARHWGAPSALAIAELQLGLAAGDEAQLERAATALAATPRRLELARALLALGASRRRANRRAEAREPGARSTSPPAAGPSRLQATRVRSSRPVEPALAARC